MASSSSSLLLPLGSIFVKRTSPNHCILPVHKNQSPVVRCSASEQGARVVSTTKYNENVTLTNRRSAIGLIFAMWGLDVASPFDAKGAGLPPEEKPKLCDNECEKELENVPMITTESGLQYKDIKIGQGPSPPVGFQIDNPSAISSNHKTGKISEVASCTDYRCRRHLQSPFASQVAANYVAMVPSGQVFDSSLEKGQPYIFRVGSGQVIKGLDEGILSMKIGGKRRIYIPGSLAFPKGLNSAPGRPRVAPNSPVIFDVSLEYIPGLELDEE